MTNYIYLGYGTTGSDGVAHLDHDANGDPVNHSYTGVGAGELDIVASLDDPNTISDSSLQSRTYEVLDCLKYDSGTGENSIWTLGNNNNASLTTGSDYRILSEITLGTDAWVYLKIDHQCVLEFDVQVVSTDYTKPFGQFGQSTNALTRRQINLPSEIQNGNWHHIKLSLQNGVATMTSLELSRPVAFTLSNYDSSGDMYWRFRTDTDITEVHFKEFKYYPI